MDLLKTHTKERMDMILEPLQVMIQLSILSHCPIGTKVSVSENLLHIQQPSLVQGVVRYWHNDKKDDLYYLFNAIRRYYSWYKSQNHKIFNYILNHSINGINNLMDTYRSSDQHTITHTLSLYKNVLDMDKEELFKSSNDTTTIDEVFKNITSIYDDKSLKVIYNTLKKLEEEKIESNKQNYIKSLYYFLIPVNNEIKNWINTNLSL
tara:strand:- start:325 stop:945 length:621 start_codon:yes stop_codon:yes gene_type:complete